MARKRETVTFLEVAIARALDQGYSRMRSGMVAGRVNAFVVEWGMWLDETGADTGADHAVERFAEWACISRATAWRRVKEFRELFPEHSTPSDVPVVELRRVFVPAV